MPKILSPQEVITAKGKKDIPGELFNNPRIYRLLDANFNRAREGLRIVEDFFRFILPENKIARKLKRTRLELNTVVQSIYPQLIQARDSSSDFGAKTKEKKRKDLNDLVRANFSRIQEALRVLEEFGKIDSAALGKKFKKLRFGIYGLEKDIFLALKDNELTE